MKISAAAAYTPGSIYTGRSAMLFVKIRESIDRGIQRGPHLRHTAPIIFIHGTQVPYPMAPTYGLLRVHMYRPNIINVSLRIGDRPLNAQIKFGMVFNADFTATLHKIAADLEAARLAFHRAEHVAQDRFLAHRDSCWRASR